MLYAGYSEALSECITDSPHFYKSMVGGGGEQAAPAWKKGDENSSSATGGRFFLMEADLGLDQK